MSSEHVRQHIETAIERARERVSDRIDELDERLRTDLDFAQLAADHAPQLLAAGAVLGFLVGYGIPRVLLRSVQLGVPVWLAVQIVKRRRESAASEPGVNPPF